MVSFHRTGLYFGGVTWNGWIETVSISLRLMLHSPQPQKHTCKCPPGTLGSKSHLNDVMMLRSMFSVLHQNLVFSSLTCLNRCMISAATVFTVLGEFISHYFIYAYSLHIFNFHRVLSFSSANYPLCEYERVSEHTYVHFPKFFVPLSLLLSQLVLLITHLSAFPCFSCD